MLMISLVEKDKLVSKHMFSVDSSGVLPSSNVVNAITKDPVKAADNIAKVSIVEDPTKLKKTEAPAKANLPNDKKFISPSKVEDKQSN